MALSTGVLHRNRPRSWIVRFDLQSLFIKQRDDVNNPRSISVIAIAKEFYGLILSDSRNDEHRC
jgi:hypothetical protein